MLPINVTEANAEQTASLLKGLLSCLNAICFAAYWKTLLAVQKHLVCVLSIPGASFMSSFHAGNP